MVQQIHPRDLAAKRQAGAPIHLLDVRQQWEHEAAALPDSQLIPLNQLADRVVEVQQSPGALLVVYCHHGVRSLSAAAYLERLGYPDVVSLTGGIDAWSQLIDPSIPRY